ncbi:cyclophilin-like fold protein [Paenibacillus taichungensis]|uniref:cyclophilin-like fold protein n=1 Tax=Paenibacillus taichungensis TaxID=484184 RepID=UPI003824402C
MIPIHIIIGGNTFTATLNNNETTQALIAQFPMTIQMKELNGLEKYNDLPEELPAASTERPETIHAGEIMSWSGNTLVLFNQTFSNSYGGYVLLGSVDDPSNLAATLGSGHVQVTWSLAE